MIEAHSALFFVNRLVQFIVHERQLIAEREAIAGDLSDAALRGKADIATATERLESAALTVDLHQSSCASPNRK